MQITPYLFFPGTCQHALVFYAQVLNAPAPELMFFKDMPEEDKANMPGTPDMAVMNGTVTHAGGRIMASDGSVDQATGLKGAYLHLALDSVTEAHRVFNAFAEGGEVEMPMSETFWTPAFGSVTDRFGTKWMVSVEEGVTG